MNAKAIELDNEQIDTIVLGELKSIFNVQISEIDRLNNLPTLEEYQRADRAYCKEVRDAARVLIEYHMAYDEAVAYFRNIRDQHA
jgi:hypothetical protein